MKEYEYGFVRVGAAVPKLKVGNVDHNVLRINELIQEARRGSVSLLVFPELCVTGYTAGDLFHNELLLEQSLVALSVIADKTDNITAIVGSPIVIDGKLMNCAVVMSSGQIVAIVPKTNIPEYKEFYEKRWFTSGRELNVKEIEINGRKVTVGTDILLKSLFDSRIKIGIEICEDLWLPIPPSSYQALGGATILANLSASNEVVGKAEYRKNLVEMQSGKCIAGYVYTSAGVHESTTDVVFSGHAIIAENSHIVRESERFNRGNQLIISDIDIDHCLYDRLKTTSFGDMSGDENRTFREVGVSVRFLSSEIIHKKKINPTPFIPGDEEKREEVTREIFEIQVAGLAKRLEASGIEKIVLGLSGGLDSTLAFLVAIEALDKLGLPRENLHAITMPGFGTTDRTKDNAIKLARAAGVTLNEISIADGATQILQDISHEGGEDVTYENAQARYRTLILFQTANQIGGLVLGTGDLSEIALGWCTFNGDHISNYNVNGSIPKTLVKYIVDSVRRRDDDVVHDILHDILETPISPELIGGKDGEITQSTEEKIGPYILHDFFLYHFIRWGSSPTKILFLAKIAFEGQFEEEEIKKWLVVFIKRFFQNQWKRSNMTDGPKVGSVSLSPRGDWRMPSDADVAIWLLSL